ncbi:Mrp/NBP35 family ATP-binding protein [Pelagibacteraceae bacterium]|nr:Mrp/NBP35 family ATP-binding protein [Pelagibacteraceae bacterium]
MDAKSVNLSKEFVDKISPRSKKLKLPINGVKKIIAISSAKGGVGKSTIAVNLAIALKKLNYKVGILDADIYGPSIPQMLGVSDKPKSEDGKNLIPISKYGLQCMSIGFMVNQDTAMIWRGPMVISAIKTFTTNVLWDNLDYLVIDLPPGTGDALLTFSQEIQIDGAVVISTPQEVALLDANRGIKMFQKTNVKILGIIENMSSFTSDDGKEHFIFGKNGAKKMSENLGIDLLGTIPIEIGLREGADKGKPYMEFVNDSLTSNKVLGIAKKISEKIK